MNFDNFFKNVYLPAHSKIGTKLFHLAGLALAETILVASVVTGHYWYALTAPMFGYGLAFSGHFWVEHNTPETFRHPFLSFLGDHKMIWLLVTGKL